MHMSTLTNYETALFSNLITHPGCQSFKKIMQVHLFICSTEKYCLVYFFNNLVGYMQFIFNSLLFIYYEDLDTESRVNSLSQYHRTQLLKYLQLCSSTLWLRKNISILGTKTSYQLNVKQYWENMLASFVCNYSILVLICVNISHSLLIRNNNAHTVLRNLKV